MAKVSDDKKPETSGRGRSYHHGDLKSALLAAARQMLEQDGPEAISFRAVARAVGVSQTAPYNHFQGKEHLLATVAAEGFRALEAAERAAIAGLDRSDKPVTALGRAYVRFAAENPQLYRLMFGVGIADWRTFPDVAEAKKASFRPVHEALAVQMGVGLTDDTRPAAETAGVTAWAFVHGLSMLLIDKALDPAAKRAGSPDTLLDQVMDWFGTGLEAAAAAALKDIAPRR